MKVKKNVGNLFINNAVFNNFSNATAMGEDIDNNDIKIARIEIVGDARTYHSYGNQVVGGISSSDESRIADEYSDDEILAIPHREMKNFTNTKLLDRIATIDKELLTLQQRRLLRQEYSKKYTISRKQLRNILQQIKDCDDIYFIGRECYDNFLSKYNLKQRDCRYIIKALNIEDYYKNTRSRNWDYFGNDIIIFRKKDIELPNGNIIKDVLVYIKLDISQSNNDLIAVISFHDNEDNQLEQIELDEGLFQ